MPKYLIDNTSTGDIVIPYGTPPQQRLAGIPANSYQNALYVDDQDSLAFEALVATNASLVLRKAPDADLTNSGGIPENTLELATNPANDETITIGGHTFIFKTTLIAPISNQTQIKIGADADVTRASTVKAINGTVAPTEWVSATTPFAAAVVASQDATLNVLWVALADKRGGTAVPGVAPSIAFADTLGAATDVWGVDNLNKMGGKVAGKKLAIWKQTILASNITQGQCWVRAPFAIGEYTATVVSSAGVLRSITDAVTLEGTDRLKLALAGGVSPAVQANDVVTFMCTEA